MSIKSKQKHRRTFYDLEPPNTDRQRIGRLKLLQNLLPRSRYAPNSYEGTPAERREQKRSFAAMVLP